MDPRKDMVVALIQVRSGDGETWTDVQVVALAEFLHTWMLMG